MNATTSDPLLLFGAAADALRRGDWRGLAVFCDSSSLIAFKRQQIEMLKPANLAPELTIEQFMRHDANMPREVAEYQFAQFRKHQAPAARLRDEFPGIGSLQKLRHMTPPAVFAAWLQGRSPRYQAEILVNEGHVPQAAAAGFLETAQHEFHLVAIGAVPDGDKFVHVLFRHELDGPTAQSERAKQRLPRGLSPEEISLARDLVDMADLQIATCRRQLSGEWRLLAGDNFLGVGQFVVSVGYDQPATETAEES